MKEYIITILCLVAFSIMLTSVVKNANRQELIIDKIDSLSCQQTQITKQDSIIAEQAVYISQIEAELDKRTEDLKVINNEMEDILRTLRKEMDVWK
ncbi:MAG: hypothetical protein DRQ46_00580 [Gammaproteobacteria bacterium]|nr:MAG: hypothetical protein DRQ46_00580 [Gammaproteobacteria bacterium]